MRRMIMTIAKKQPITKPSKVDVRFIEMIKKNPTTFMKYRKKILIQLLIYLAQNLLT